MDISRELVYSPIVIKLETYAEALAFYGIVSGESDEESERMAKKLADWMVNETSL